MSFQTPSIRNRSVSWQIGKWAKGNFLPKRAFSSPSFIYLFAHLFLSAWCACLSHEGIILAAVGRGDKVGGGWISQLLLYNKSSQPLFVNISYLSWALWTRYLGRAQWSRSGLGFLGVKCRPEGSAPLAAMPAGFGGKPQSHPTGCLRVLSAWRLASPRASGPREGEPVGGRPSQDLPYRWYSDTSTTF